MEEHAPVGKPRVAVHERYGDIEGHILGNAEGLQQLKDRIDEALQSGVGLSRDLDSDFNSVLLLDTHPRDLKGHANKERLPQATCIVIGVVVILGAFAAISYWLI